MSLQQSFELALLLIFAVGEQYIVHRKGVEYIDALNNAMWRGWQ